jgi:hypothetical protein
MRTLVICGGWLDLLRRRKSWSHARYSNSHFEER